MQWECVGAGPPPCGPPPPPPPPCRHCRPPALPSDPQDLSDPQSRVRARESSCLRGGAASPSSLTTWGTPTVDSPDSETAETPDRATFLPGKHVWLEGRAVAPPVTPNLTVTFPPHSRERTPQQGGHVGVPLSV